MSGWQFRGADRVSHAFVWYFINTSTNYFPFLSSLNIMASPKNALYTYSSLRGHIFCNLPPLNHPTMYFNSSISYYKNKTNTISCDENVNIYIPAHLYKYSPYTILSREWKRETFFGIRFHNFSIMFIFFFRFSKLLLNVSFLW